MTLTDGLAKFIRPYYLLLNKPYPASSALRIHRHTIPPFIPLSALARRYLPAPSGDKDRPQNLVQLVRLLRRDLVSYHNRHAVVSDLRRALGLDTEAGKGKQRTSSILDIQIKDAEAQELRIEWADGKIGRATVTKEGKLGKCVVFGDEGREKGVERMLVGGKGGLLGLEDSLREVG